MLLIKGLPQRETGLIGQGLGGGEETANVGNKEMVFQGERGGTPENDLYFKRERPNEGMAELYSRDRTCDKLQGLRIASGKCFQNDLTPWVQNVPRRGEMED